MRPLLAKWTAILAASAAAVLAQEPEAKPLTEEQRALFALLDEFDPLDTSKLPFVRYEIDHGRSKSAWHGFLLARDNESFTVREVPGGQVVSATFLRQPGSAFRGSYAPAEIPDRETTLIAEADVVYRERPMVADWIALARAYAQRGQVADVHRLWAEVPALQDSKKESTREAVARFVIEWLNYDFLDPSLSWEQLLARHDLWLLRFGGKESWFDEHVQRNRAGIAEVLEAKAKRAKRSGTPTPTDLVFDLHDEFWLPETGRGECLACTALPPRDGDTPLQRVKNAGLACVPDLIAALDDYTLMRSVRGYARRMVTIPIGRFGEAAEAALVEIAGYTPEGEDRRKAWEEWFEHAKTSSPEAVLEARIDELDYEATRRYLDVDARRFTRVLKAITACDDASRRSSGVWAAVGSLQQPLSAELLDQLARVAAESLDGSAQVSAAKVLLEHGRGAVVDVVAKSWLTAVREPSPRLRIHVESQAEFLMQHGVATWKALEEGCHEPRGRSALAWVLAYWSTVDYRALAKGPAEPHLLQCLTMLAEEESTFGHAVELKFDGRQYRLQTATIADIAAARLAECWPEEHRFDPTRTSSVRRAQRQNARFGRAFEPARRDPPLQPNLVTKVTLDANTAPLPAESLERLRSLEQRELSLELLHETTLAVARTATGRSVVLDCERTGLGEGTTVHVSLSDEEPSSMCGGSTGTADWTKACQFSIGGAADTRTPAQVMADFADKNISRESLDDAFAAPATTGVELRFVMQVR